MAGMGVMRGVAVASLRHDSFKRLGYLSLDSNERSNWQASCPPFPPPPADSCPVDLPPGARTNTQQARELKSVQLDAYGRFIKVAQLDRV